MTGQKWTEFLDSVKTSGIIEPIVVTQNKVIVSGHQRVRACKELGIQSIMAEIRLYDDEENVIKDLIETNLRQRGDISSSSLKMGRIIDKLEGIYGIRQGRPEKTSDNVGNKTQADLAKELGMSVDSLNNYKKLATLIPELQDMVDSDKISASVASRVLARLSPDEQSQLILTYGKEEIEKATQAKAKEMVDEMAAVKNVNSALQMKLKNKENAIESAINDTAEKYNQQILELTTAKNMLERKVKLNQEDADKYNKLKSDIDFLTRQKNDLSRQIESATELSGMTVRIQNVLEKELAPIKYKRHMEMLNESDVAMQNLVDVIDTVQKWVDEMRMYLPNGNCVDVSFKEV